MSGADSGDEKCGGDNDWGGRWSMVVMVVMAAAVAMVMAVTVVMAGGDVWDGNDIADGHDANRDNGGDYNGRWLMVYG